MRRSVEEALRSLHDHRDAEALERVWQRLETRRTRPRVARPHPAPRLVAAAALLGAGVWVGMMVERSVQERSVSVRGELLVPMAGSSEEREPEQEETEPVFDEGERQRHASSALRSRRGPPRSRPKAGELSDQGSGAASSSETPTEVVAVRSASWLVLAERGDFAGAFQELDEKGGFDTVLRDAGPDELMTLVDVARTVGRDARAIQALRIVVERYREDDNAPLAAMMLGNLLSRLGDAEGAAEAFALNRALSPGGDFAEDALVREFEMAVDALDVSTARRLRVQYEQEYPEGRHRDGLRTEWERLLLEVQPPEGTSAEQGASTEDSRDDRADDEQWAGSRPADESSRDPLASPTPTNPYAP